MFEGGTRFRQCTAARSPRRHATDRAASNAPASVTSAPEDRAVALALSGSVALGGQGIGAAYGGAVIATVGLAWCGLAGALVTLAGAWLAARSFRHG